MICTLPHIPTSVSAVLRTVKVVPLMEMKVAEKNPPNEKVLAPHMLAIPAAVLAESGLKLSV